MVVVVVLACVWGGGFMGAAHSVTLNNTHLNWDSTPLLYLFIFLFIDKKTHYIPFTFFVDLITNQISSAILKLYK